MNLKVIPLREAVEACVEDEPVYMIIKMDTELSVMDLYGADGYVVMQEEPEPEPVPEPKPAKQPKQKKQIWEPKQDPVRIDHGKIVALYKAKWSIKKISDEIGCSQQTVINHLKKEGVYNVQETD
ncbi:MAG: helix-turn-helix domain-containing protein [Lachnospiraceae bacterium]|nr:helix-turn-helix domain-containing protein [Lachnospiraceae bacterium]